MSESVENTEEKVVKWTTWEELLLACAVKRHGIKDWDSIAMEIQNRSSVPVSLINAQSCKIKYRDLKRRFVEEKNRDDDEHDEIESRDDEIDSIPWLEELRKLRVAELKQEVQRYDLSIQSLQLKVEKLEQERERSLKENENGDEKPDLEKDLKEDRSEENREDGDGAPEHVPGKSVSGQDSDRENRSFNESNSTGGKGDNQGTGAEDGGRAREPDGAGVCKPDRASSDSKPAGEDSSNGSSKLSRGNNKVGNSAELRDSATESKEGSKESSEAQSSASLTRKRRRSREVSGGGDEAVASVSPATTTTTTNASKGDAMKSEPLVGVLDMIRSHKYGLVFEHRLESQKTEKYKKIVRQHVDLETVQTRLNDGSYSTCPSKLHRDLLLLLNNAIVFFPKTSSKSLAAYELRDLLLKEIRKIRTQRPDPKPEPASSKPLPPQPDPERSGSLLGKQKSSAPIVVCRKRSSISAKPSNPTKTEKQPIEKTDPDSKPSSSVKEEQSPPKTKMREKPVTGVRSLRRGNRSQTNNTPIESQSNKTDSADQKGESISSKKKNEVIALAKKRGAADFLKRIKKHSPAKGTLLERLKNSVNEDSGGRREQKKRGEEKREGNLRRSSGGGGRQVKEEISPSKRSVGRPPKRGKEVVPAKRGREGGGGDDLPPSKRPNKRSRK